MAQEITKRFTLKSLSSVAVLQEIAKGGCNMTQLAKMAGRTTAAITGTIDRMERAGIVARSREHDRRMVIVNFTPAGRKAWDEIVKETPKL